MEIPDKEIVQEITRQACSSLQERIYFDEVTGQYRSKICSVCDRIHVIKNPVNGMRIHRLRKRLLETGATQEMFREIFPPEIMDYYRVENNELKDFILSNKTRIYDEGGSRYVDVCKECKDHFRRSPKRSREKTIFGPKFAIWKGGLVGHPPDVLTRLNEAELSILSLNKNVCHAYVLQSNTHEGIFGFHSMFQNRVQTNINNIAYLESSGLVGKFVCVLCGPFDKRQVENVRKKFEIRPSFVFEAFDWLKTNNFYHEEFEIPNVADMEPPKILFDPTL